MTDKATAASYVVNSSVATFGIFTFNQMLAIVGTALAIATFTVNWFYQRRRDRRDAEYHRVRMAQKDKQ